MPFRFFPRSHSQSQIEPEYVDLKEIKGEKLVKRLEDRTESERTLHVSSQEQLKSIHESLWHTHQTQSSLSDSTTVMKDDLTLSLEGLNLDFSKKSPKKNLLMRFLKKDIKPIKKDLPVRPSAVLTSEQKMALALEERDLRLKEVISVLENRRPMPKRLEHMKIHNFLGDGTYGFVLTSFLGKKEVAIKFIYKNKVPPSAWITDDNYKMIPSEIFFLKRLSHPNIISYLGYYEDEKYYYLITELHGTSWDSENPTLKSRKLEGLKHLPRAKRVGSDGKGDLNTLSSLNSKQRLLLKPRVSCDLFECVDAHDFFPEAIVRHIFKQIAEAVKYLHENGIVHRDLKDENVVIDENYNVKLIDFGSAAFIPPPGAPLFDQFLGTIDFAAPEIIEGFRYRGTEAEVWALGVLLFILIFRQVPFKSPKDIVEVRMHITPGLINFYKGASDLLDLLHLILQKNPDLRPAVPEILKHPWLTKYDELI